MSARSRWNVERETQPRLKKGDCPLFLDLGRTDCARAGPYDSGGQTQDPRLRLANGAVGQDVSDESSTLTREATETGVILFGPQFCVAGAKDLTHQHRLNPRSRELPSARLG